jgi:hypothetical protein
MKFSKFLIILLITNNCFSQKPFLTKAITESYSPIVGGTVLSNISDCDDCSQNLNLGFNFVFNGQQYSNIYISSNGIVTLNSFNNEFENNFGNNFLINSNNVIAPWWDDLETTRTFVSEGTAKYLISGNAPNRKITIEWDLFHHFDIRSSNSNNQKVTFQATFFENSDKIKFNYKKNSYTSGNLMTASIGFKFSDNTFLAFNQVSNSSILNTTATLVNNTDYARFSDYQDNLALYFSSETLNITSPIASLTSCFGVSSTPTTFGVTGSNLTASVTITAPSKFEISRTQGGSYSSSLTLDYNSTVSETLYVRMNSSATEGVNTGTISATSTGATDATTTVSGTVLAKPTLSTSSILLCAEATYLITKTTVIPVDNGWSTSSNTITVNNGYVTAGTATGNYTVSYTDGCAQTVSASVTVNNLNNATAITEGQAQYKINNTIPIPQGPSASLYIGYNGTNYYSATRPTNTGFYKANNQSTNNAGCPYPFYIFRCATCPD